MKIRSHLCKRLLSQLPVSVCPEVSHNPPHSWQPWLPPPSGMTGRPSHVSPMHFVRSFAVPLPPPEGTSWAAILAARCCQSTRPLVAGASAPWGAAREAQSLCARGRYHHPSFLRAGLCLPPLLHLARLLTGLGQHLGPPTQRPLLLMRPVIVIICTISRSPGGAPLGSSEDAGCAARAAVPPCNHTENICIIVCFTLGLRYISNSQQKCAQLQHH